MRVLVTGGAGFIGSHLCKRLSDKFVLDLTTGVDRYNVADIDGNISTNILDNVELDRLFKAAKPDSVVHLAAESSICTSDPQLQHDTNCTGTYNVLEACRRYGVKRFIFASSAAVYGDAEVFPTSEDELLDPKSLYAATKVYGEA